MEWSEPSSRLYHTNPVNATIPIPQCKSHKYFFPVTRPLPLRLHHFSPPLQAHLHPYPSPTRLSAHIKAKPTHTAAILLHHAGAILGRIVRVAEQHTLVARGLLVLADAARFHARGGVAGGFQGGAEVGGCGGRWGVFVRWGFEETLRGGAGRGREGWERDG